MRRSGFGQYQFPSPYGPPQTNAMFGSHQGRNSSHHFVVENYDQPSFSGYRKRVSSLLSHGKRKSDSQSTFHPRTKQQITEERITSSMQQLNLNLHFPSNNNTVGIGQPSGSSRAQDEGFFEEVNNSSSDDELFDADNRESDLWNASKLPQFQLAPGIKESLNNMHNNFLPKKILDDMNQSCLAVIPYSPPQDLLIAGNDGDISINDKISENDSVTPRRRPSKRSSENEYPRISSPIDVDEDMSE